MTQEIEKQFGERSLKELARLYRAQIKRERTTYTPDTDSRAETVSRFLDTLTADDGRALDSPSLRTDAIEAIDKFAAARAGE